MNYNTSTYQGKLLADQKYKSLLEKGKIISLDEVTEDRSTPQSRARWLYLTMSANDLNERGIEYQITKKLSCKFTKDLLYEVYWKSLQSVMFPKKKRLNTKQFSELVEMIIIMFARLYSIDIAFPSIENLRDEQKAKSV